MLTANKQCYYLICSCVDIFASEKTNAEPLTNQIGQDLLVDDVTPRLRLCCLAFSLSIGSPVDGAVPQIVRRSF